MSATLADRIAAMQIHYVDVRDALQGTYPFKAALDEGVFNSVLHAPVEMPPSGPYYPPVTFLPGTRVECVFLVFMLLVCLLHRGVNRPTFAFSRWGARVVAFVPVSPPRLFFGNSWTQWIARGVFRLWLVIQACKCLTGTYVLLRFGVRCIGPSTCFANVFLACWFNSAWTAMAKSGSLLRMAHTPTRPPHPLLTGDTLRLVSDSQETIFRMKSARVVYRDGVPSLDEIAVDFDVVDLSGATGPVESTVTPDAPLPVPAMDLGPASRFDVSGMYNGKLTSGGIGFRVGNKGILADHEIFEVRCLMHHCDDLVLSRGKTQLKLKKSSLKFERMEAPEGSVRSGSGRDLCAFELTPAQWAVLGVAQLPVRQVCLDASAKITVFGNPDGVLKVAHGSLVADATRTYASGLVAHTANTVAGFSGSPLYTLKNGKYHVCGVHIMGPHRSFAGAYNHAVSAPQLIRFLRQLKLLPSVDEARLRKLAGDPTAQIESCLTSSLESVQYQEGQTGADDDLMDRNGDPVAVDHGDDGVWWDDDMDEEEEEDDDDLRDLAVSYRESQRFAQQDIHPDDIRVSKEVHQRNRLADLDQIAAVTQGYTHAWDHDGPGDHALTGAADAWESPPVPGNSPPKRDPPFFAAIEYIRAHQTAELPGVPFDDLVTSLGDDPSKGLTEECCIYPLFFRAGRTPAYLRLVARDAKLRVEVIDLHHDSLPHLESPTTPLPYLVTVEPTPPPLVAEAEAPLAAPETPPDSQEPATSSPAPVESAPVSRKQRQRQARAARSPAPAPAPKAKAAPKAQAAPKAAARPNVTEKVLPPAPQELLLADRLAPLQSAPLPPLTEEQIAARFPKELAPGMFARPVEELPKRAYSRFVGDKPPNMAPVPTVPAPGPETDAAIAATFSRLHAGSWEALGEFTNCGWENLARHPCFAEYFRLMSASRMTAKASGHPMEHMDDRNGKPFAVHKGSCAGLFTKPSELRYMSPQAVAAAAAVGENIPSDGHPAPFCMPPSGPAAVRASLQSQFSKQDKFGNWDHLAESPTWKADIREFASRYDPAQPSDNIRKTFEAVVAGMDGTKSAGFSQHIKAGTKAEWQTEAGITDLWYLVCCRLALRASVFSRLPTFSPMTMIALGLMDPENIFTKPEAHGVKKIAACRWRCIWNISMVDCSIQALLHSKQNKRDLHSFQTGEMSHQAAGMGHHDDGVARMSTIFEEMSSGGTVAVTDDDAEGFDISCRRDFTLLDTEVRMDRQEAWVRQNPCHELAHRSPTFWEGQRVALMCEAFCNSAHVVCIPGPRYCELWEVSTLGITASGIQSTTAQNCRGRAFQAEQCGMGTEDGLSLVAPAKPRPEKRKCGVVLGDDLAHRGIQTEEMLAKVRRCGTLIKQHHTAYGEINFTSHLYTRQANGQWTAKFDNFHKMLAHIDLRRVPNQPPSDDVVKGCLFVVRNDLQQTERLRAYVALLGGNRDLAADAEAAAALPF